MYGHTFFINIIYHRKQSWMHGVEDCIRYEKFRNMLVIGLCCSDVKYTTIFGRIYCTKQNFVQNKSQTDVSLVFASNMK